MIVAVSSVVLLVSTVRKIKTSSRYLYRYIIFALSWVCILICDIIAVFSSQEMFDVFALLIWLISVFATTWRILEVTVFNNYFNSLKNEAEADQSSSYIPLN